MILIALGANLPSRYGSPEQTLIAAQATLEDLGVRIVARSRIWKSAPVPLSDQPWYHNAVVAVRTSLTPEGLMALLQGIEQDFGRIRTGVRDEARLLDLDILAYDERVLQDGDLCLPHPRLHERGFVLYPLREIAADWVHPVLKCTLADMIGALPADQLLAPLESAAA